MVRWTLILDVIQDIRGTLGMYMFIVEESMQTVGMSLWQLYKAEMYGEVRNTAQWCLDNIINPAIEFCETYGKACYPLNMAYLLFFESSKRNVETYLDLTKGLTIDVVASPELKVRFTINGVEHKTPYTASGFFAGQKVTIKNLQPDGWEGYEWWHMEINGAWYEETERMFVVERDTTVKLVYSSD